MSLALGIPLWLVLAQAGLPLPVVEVRPSTANVSIGERFQVTVEVKGDPSTTYEFPGELSTAAVELKLSRPVSRAANTAVYDAQVFALGAEARIPEIEVRYQSADGADGVARSMPVPLNVISSLDPNEKDPAPADFAPPVPVLVSRAFWITSGLAGVLLVTLLALLVRRLRLPRKPAEVSVTPAVSPEEEAMTRLETLAARQAAMEPKGFYIELIQVVKLYLERRLNAPILEMTSTETMAFVKNHGWTAPHAAGLRDLVSSADLVKFGGSSDASNADRQIQLARELVGRIDRLRRVDAELREKEQDRRKSA